MAQWVRLVSKSGDLYLILGIYMVEGKNRSLQVVLYPPYVLRGMYTSPNTDKTNK